MAEYSGTGHAYHFWHCLDRCFLLFCFFRECAEPKENVRDELAGNLWAVHGGGFYYLEKYKVAPKTIPKHLHWFKYEAYFTWVSGFALLFIIYYFNASAMLIDTNVMKLTATQAIASASVHLLWLGDL